MKKETYKIQGMHCASCAGIIEKTLTKIEGAHMVEVNYGTETAKISYDETKTSPHNLSGEIEPLGYSLIVEENHSKHSDASDIHDMRVKVFSATPLAVFSIFIMSWEILSQFGMSPEMPPIWEEFFHHLLPLMATYVLFVVGKPYLLGFYRFLRYGKANMDTLIGIGTSAAYIYSFVATAFEETLRPLINVDATYYMMLRLSSLHSKTCREYSR